MDEIDNKLIRAYDKTFWRRLPIGNVLNDLLYGNPYKTCTALFRSCLIDDYNDLVVGNYYFKMGDYPRWLVIASKAKVGYINESTAVYRIRQNSASHSSELENHILFLKSTYRVSIFFAKYYNFRINKKKRRRIYQHSILSYLAKKKRFNTLFSYAGCYPVALAVICKEWMRRLMIWRVNGFK